MAFNKMFVMVPVMLAARKLDGEDPATIQYLRIAYGCMQTLCVLAVIYTYLQAMTVSKKHTHRVVYVPPAPTPFQDPNATAKKYTETNYGAHVLSTARSLLGSTLFGVAMTVGLHWYKGMVVGLAIQAVMGPLNLIENPLVKALFMGGGKIEPETKLFDEKLASELTQEDEVVDESGNPLVRAIAGGAGGAGSAASVNSGSAGGSSSQKDRTMMSLEEVMLDTWDSGDKADISHLMSTLTSQNCNHQTKQDQWTPLMILAGLGQVKGTASAIRQAIELGANPGISDKDGWNALHWAGFHSNPDAAKELCKGDLALLEVTDKEGSTPLEISKKENNAAVTKIMEEAKATAENDKSEDADGVRKRK